MARKSDHRTFNIAVVGLSGTEKQKGLEGVGKSCLCNRFMRPAADSYYTDHISVLSQTDFGGRVVNNDHFLYWGEVTKTSDEGVDLTFNVVEQTEFVDDSSFQPFKSGKTESYYKRCANTKLQSAEKLVYFCKNQLGLELEFEQRMLPSGRITVDGFICVFDVSDSSQRPVEIQVEFVCNILQNIAKTKRPCVFATTKNDQACEQYITAAERLAGRKEFKGNLALVETSAHENVNIELAFLYLAHMIDRSRTRLKIPSYSDAARARRELVDVALEAYQNLIRNMVSDYKMLWHDMRRILERERNSDYLHFVDTCGSDSAKKYFQRLTSQLKQDYVQRKQEIYIAKLKSLLPVTLPDLNIIADRSWPSILRWFKEQVFFERYFIHPDPQVVGGWRDADPDVDGRIPLDFLEEKPAETCFHNYLTDLRNKHKRQQYCSQFRDLLKDNPNVAPGKTLDEVSIFFLGRECFSVLSEEEKQQVYDQYQRELREKAKQDFQEMLFEYADMFSRFEKCTNVTQKDIAEINSRLQNDVRYRNLTRLEDDRKALILNHLGFLRCPTREYCPFRAQCMEVHMEKLLATKAHRPRSWGNDAGFVLDTTTKKLNLVILGSDSLASTLVREIRRLCVDDEYNLDGEVLSLDYRPVDGDVSLPQNSFRTEHFKPHGCFCVFSSAQTLDFVRRNLHKTLLSDTWSAPTISTSGASTLHSGVGVGSGGATHSITGHHGPAGLAPALPGGHPTAPNTGVISSGTSMGVTHKLSELRLTEDTGGGKSYRQPFQGLPIVLVLAHEAALTEEQLRLLREDAQSLADKFQCPFIDIPSSMMTDNRQRFHADQIGLAMHELQQCMQNRSAVVDSRQIAESIEPDIRILMCCMCGDSYQVELLLSPLLKHQCCYVAPDKYPTLTLETYLDASKRKVEVTVVPYHTGTFLRDSLYHGFVLAYSPKRKASLANLRAFSSKLQRVPIKVLAVTESLGAKAFFCNDLSQSLIAEGNNLADKLNASFMSTSPNFMHQVESYTPFFKEAWERKVTTEKAFSFDPDEQYSDLDPTHILKNIGTRKQSALPNPPYTTETFSTFGIGTRKNPLSSMQYTEEPIYDTPIHHMNRGALSDSECDNDTYYRSRTAAPSAHHSGAAGVVQSLRDHVVGTSSTLAPSRRRAPPIAVEVIPPSVDLTTSMDDPDNLYSEICVDDTDQLIHNSHSSSEDIQDVDHHGGSAANTNSTFKTSPIIAASKSIPATAGSTTANTSVKSRRNMYAGWHEDGAYEKTPLIPQSVTAKKTKPAGKHKPLDFQKYANVRSVLTRNIDKANMKKDNASTQASKEAPLATPEHIEMEDAYSTVLDAVDLSSENHYALVYDALPQGKMHRVRPSHPSSKHDKEVKGTSPSEGSEGTGDETLQGAGVRKTKKRRSLKGQRSATSTALGSANDPASVCGVDSAAICSRTAGDLSTPAGATTASGAVGGPGVHMSSSDVLVTPYVAVPFLDTEPTTSLISKHNTDEDVDPLTPRDCTSPGRFTFQNPRMDALKPWKHDPDKQRKKEERRLKEDEKRKQKEEEKKLKEQQKLQRKARKKADKLSTPSTSSIGALEDMSQSEENLVPYFVQKCVEYIEQEGLSCEGLYRVPGNKAHGDLLMEKFKEDPHVDIGTLDIPLNAVATALKGFFGDLNKPLIPSYEELLSTTDIQNKQEQLSAIREVMLRLPNSNFEVLSYLITHLHNVTTHSTENSMDSKNLAICFWPTLIRPDITTLERMTTISTLLEGIIQSVIDHHRYIFYDEKET